MGDVSVEPLLSFHDQEDHEQPPPWSPVNALVTSEGTLQEGHSLQLMQCLVICLTRAFDAQQCFITTFTDSSSCCPSNVLSDWSLQGKGALLTSLPSAAFFLGCIVGGLVLAPLADTRLGRKNLLLLSCLVMSLSGLLAIFSPDLYVYSALRFTSGFGRASIGTCALVLSTELVGPRWRPYVGLLSFALFALGFASLSGIAYVTCHSSWRNVYLWTSLPALLYCLVVYLFVEDSPRWMQLERTAATGTYSAVRALVSRKWIRRRLGLVTVISFGLGIAYYGMPLGLSSLSFNLYLSFAIEALVDLPAALAAFCLIGSVNRKSSMLVTTTLSGVLSIACGLMSGSSWVQLALELMAYVIGCTAYDIGMIYASELFPTCVRNSAVSLARQVVMLGGGAGALLASLGESLIAYGGFGAVLMLCGVFVLWLPETRSIEPCDTMEEEELKLSTSPGLLF